MKIIVYNYLSKLFNESLALTRKSIIINRTLLFIVSLIYTYLKMKKLIRIDFDAPRKERRTLLFDKYTSSSRYS